MKSRWEYRLVYRKGAAGGYGGYGIHDVCVREDGTTPNWEGEPVSLDASTEERLRERLARVAEALEKPVLVWQQSLTEEAR